jgi:hypothetical protein
MSWNWRFFDDALAIGGTVTSTVDAVAAGTCSGAGGSVVKIAGVPSMIARWGQRNWMCVAVQFPASGLAGRQPFRQRPG